MGYVRFENIKHLVLDEADRMLDMDLSRIYRPSSPICRSINQTLMFSATMPNNIRQLAQKIMHNRWRFHCPFQHLFMQLTKRSAWFFRNRR